VLIILHCREIGSSRFLANGSFGVVNNPAGRVNQRSNGWHLSPKSKTVFSFSVAIVIPLPQNQIE